MKFGRFALLSSAALLAYAPRCFAPPPLITGDVPTAPKDGFEWHLDFRYP